MIDFVFKVNIDGAEKALHALADSLEDVTTPLLRTGGKIRSRAEKLFTSEGNGAWPALAESTQQRKGRELERFKFSQVLPRRGRAAADNVLRMQRAVDRARDSFAKADAGSKRQHAAAIRVLRTMAELESQVDAHGDAAFRPNRKTRTANTLVEAARQAVARRKQHGAMLRSVKVLKRAGYALTDAERRSMTRKGQQRYAYGGHVQVLKDGVRERLKAIGKMKGAEAAAAMKALKAEHGGHLHEYAAARMLGNLANTLGMKVDDGRLTVYSKAYISGIHNDGGTAGHGAKIPERPFLFLTDADLDLFVEVLRERAIAAWTED